MCGADFRPRIHLLLIIRFVASFGKDMAAGAGFVTGQSAGLADGATHHHKYLHPLAARRALYLRQPGCSLTFLTSSYQHIFSPYTITANFSGASFS